jgi:hypothetical protein
MVYGGGVGNISATTIAGSEQLAKTGLKKCDIDIANKVLDFVTNVN